MNQKLVKENDVDPRIKGVVDAMPDISSPKTKRRHKVICPECNGTGKKKQHCTLCSDIHKCKCLNCNGTGKIESENLIRCPKCEKMFSCPLSRTNRCKHSRLKPYKLLYKKGNVYRECVCDSCNCKDYGSEHEKDWEECGTRFLSAINLRPRPKFMVEWLWDKACYSDRDCPEIFTCALTRGDQCHNPERRSHNSLWDFPQAEIFCCDRWYYEECGNKIIGRLPKKKVIEAIKLIEKIQKETGEWHYPCPDSWYR